MYWMLTEKQLTIFSSSDQQTSLQLLRKPENMLKVAEAIKCTSYCLFLLMAKLMICKRQSQKSLTFRRWIFQSASSLLVLVTKTSQTWFAWTVMMLQSNQDAEIWSSSSSSKKFLREVSPVRWKKILQLSFSKKFHSSLYQPSAKRSWQRNEEALTNNSNY